MRLSRPFLVLAILGVLIAVGASYYLRKRTQEREAPSAPASLPPNTAAAATDWRWAKTEGSRTVVEVRAANFRQVQEPSRFYLEKVELRIFGKDGSSFNQVRCAAAEFDSAEGLLRSSGEVDITMGVPSDGRPSGRLIFIHATAVDFSSKTGKVSTDGPASFRFDRGEGKAVGAFYDPATRELRMKSAAEVLWYGNGTRAKPMKVEAGELLYREQESVIMLTPWSRLTRDDFVLEAGEAFVILEDGAIRRAETRNARGNTIQAGRRIDYAAEGLTMHFTTAGAVEKILGDRKARLVSTTPAARTEVTTDRLELIFGINGGDSRLEKALASGHSTVESKPLVLGAASAPDTRVLRSDVIHLNMRPGGEEIESVQTHTPGSIEFLPNRPGGRTRRLDAERMWIDYAGENRIRAFRAVNTATRTETPPAASGKPRPAALTWSKLLVADFDPVSGDLTRLEQSDQFRYEEGARQATAKKAILEPAKETITLDGGARLSEPAGITSANRILLDQKSGDVTAEGKVASIREPGGAPAMLSGKDPLRATATRMTSASGRSVVRYDGNAVLWQGGNRIEADWVEIDRAKRRLTAGGNVRTQFLDEPKALANGAGAPPVPVYTVVRAAGLTYEDGDKVAHYRGNVKLERLSTEVTCAELRAFLVDEGGGARMDKALADGAVEIVNTAAGRTRKATAEHAEYYAVGEKVVLSGGRPLLVDSLRGSTRGARLTWFANNDSLLVEGGEGRPSVSRIQRN